jgi:hypothetical protein
MTSSWTKCRLVGLLQGDQGAEHPACNAQLADPRVFSAHAAIQVPATFPGCHLVFASLPNSLQVVREGSKRVLGLRPFDVQCIGGMILHEGQIAEMRTGEVRVSDSRIWQPIPAQRARVARDGGEKTCCGHLVCSP